MKKLRFVVTLLLLLLVIGCSNSIQTMLDDYNSNFSVTHDIVSDDSPSPGEDGFDESEMLYDIYYVSDVNVLNLAAPKNCDTYIWTVRDPEKKYDETNPRDGLRVYMFDEGSMESRMFVTYIKEAVSPPLEQDSLGVKYDALEVGKTYQITLTVTKKGVGKGTFTDTAALVVYKNYNFMH